MKTEILWKFLFFLKFWIFLKISEFSLIDDEVQVFRNINLLSNPVAELKICENDSHCRSIVLKTMDRSIVKQLEKEKNNNFNVENFVVMFIYWGTIKRYMDWDWTASFLIRFRNGTCIIILDKKYNIANSSCHFGSYGSIWTGPSPKKDYMDLRSFGPYNIFLVTDRSIYCHMTLSAMNYLLYTNVDLFWNLHIILYKLYMWWLITSTLNTF
jgi:hypothetical protein